MAKWAGVISVFLLVVCPNLDYNKGLKAAESQPVILPGDFAMELLAPEYPRPTSQWYSNEKARYQKLLSAGQFDVIVVPFQVQAKAFSRTINSLMTAQLALAISKTQKIRVADPYLVARALGEGQRAINATDVYQLANKTRTKKIIWGHIGYDINRNMQLTVSVQVAGAGVPFGPATPAISTAFVGSTIGLMKPPIIEYEELLPRILQAVGVPPSKKPDPIISAPQDTLALPATLAQLYAQNSISPLRDVYYFQVLAALTPISADRARERYAEKALLALQNVSPKSPEYRALKARGLMQLGLRQMALVQLSTPVTDEEKALSALLNGNLPDATTLATRIKSPLKRLIAELDAMLIASGYGAYESNTAEARIETLNLPDGSWPLFARRAFGDTDDWVQFNNLELKQILDSEFPLQGFTAKSIIGGAAALGDPLKAQFSADLSVHNHLGRLFEKEPSKWCCSMNFDQPTPIDYFNLIEETAIDNLARRAALRSRMQGLPEHALELLTALDPVFKGHPRFSLLRAQAEASAAERKEGSVKEGMLKSAYWNALNAYYWEQGQTFAAADAFGLMVKLRRSDYGELNNLYVADFPMRSFYPSWEHGSLDMDILNATYALENSTYDIRPVYHLNFLWREIKQDEFRADALFKQIEGRFVGSGGISSLRAKNALNKGDLRAAEIWFRDAIKSQPGQSESYEGLVDLLYRGGRINESAEIAMSFPDFSKDSNSNQVATSNVAYEMGSLYYWSGHFPQAIPLYEISANLQTGSAASITSELRLKLLKDDYIGALQGSYNRATRYNSSYAYRDYLGLLHCMGFSKEAWDAFGVLVDQLDGPHIWETALVGHRIAGTSETALIAWAKQDVFRGTGELANDAAKYLLRAGIMDRSPGELIIPAIAALDAPVWKVSSDKDRVVRVAKDGSMEYIVGPEATAGSTLPIGAFAGSKKVKVKSELVYFAEAYRAMRAKKFDNARTLLEEAAALYDLSQLPLGYMLPYLAFASAKAGNTSVVEKKLAAFKPAKFDFDRLLAGAVLKGFAGKTEESVALLRQAAVRRPYTEARPIFTEYAYAEIVDWLYEATGKAVYRDIALDWARKNQKTQPWHGWAYALEAKLSSDPTERSKAIGMANYLDPNSERLKFIPKKERDSAIKSFANRNPFLNQAAGLKENST